MHLEEIRSIVNGDYLYKEESRDLNIAHAFATDLMSDTLFLIRRDEELILLITGVTNPSAVRTAAILDIPAILIVRGKPVPAPTIEEAERQGISIIHTTYLMFSTCALLYNAGLKDAPWKI
jgi:predicted transcriptional regulator